MRPPFGLAPFWQARRLSFLVRLSPFPLTATDPTQPNQFQQMVAQTLRTIRFCKSRTIKFDPTHCKSKGSMRSIELYFRDLKIIDNQRTLTQLSRQLERRKA